MDNGERILKLLKTVARLGRAMVNFKIEHTDDNDIALYLLYLSFHISVVIDKIQDLMGSEWVNSTILDAPKRQTKPEEVMEWLALVGKLIALADMETPMEPEDRLFLATRELTNCYYEIAACMGDINDVGNTEQNDHPRTTTLISTG